MAETPLYNYQDMARYLQRKMSPQEMHAFEKALMDDPFLADALEGYATADLAQTRGHLAEIEQGLASRREISKVVPLLPRKAAWWKAAAVFIVVAAGTAFSYSLFRNKSNNIMVAQQMAADSSGKAAPQQPASTVQPEQSRATLHEPESNSRSASPVEKPLASSYKQARPAPAAGRLKKTDTVSVGLTDKMAETTISDSVAFAPVTKYEAKQAAIMRAPAAQAFNEFKGKVTDTSGEPVQFASITDNRSRVTATSDANGNFILKAPDSVINITVNSVGFVAATATMDNRKKPYNISLEKGPQSLAEVVAVGYATKRKKDITGADSSAAAEPVGGWRNFRQYLDRQVDSLHTKPGKDLYISDDVVLEFFVDEKGNPSNIKVPEQASQAVANKAVEILANGPKWKNKKRDKKVKVVIPFRSGK